MLAAVRARALGGARTPLAAARPDPLARKLVLYYRLLTPGRGAVGRDRRVHGRQSGLAAAGALLSRRLAEALLADRDDRAVLEICRAPRRPTPRPALLRCADAAVQTERSRRRRTRAGPGCSASPTRRPRRRSCSNGAASLTPDDQRRRFERLAWTETGGARAAPSPARRSGSTRPRGRPPRPGSRCGATTRPAPPCSPRCPKPRAADPGLVLDLARWYRRANRDAGGGRGSGPSAAPRPSWPRPPSGRRLFWDERNLLARAAAARRMRTRSPTRSPRCRPPAKEARIDAEFLAGWIALRRLDRPDEAVAHFQALAGLSGAAITQGRAHYWLGRALGGGGPAEPAAGGVAAGGRVADHLLRPARRAGAGRRRGRARRADPCGAATRRGTTSARSTSPASELARAAALLAAWGEPRRAKPFLQRLDELAHDQADRALAARFAAELGLPEQAVAAARRAGRDGIALAGIGLAGAGGAAGAGRARR